MPKSTNKSHVQTLSRGGVVVSTSAGPVQFGIPPETIKDTMTGPDGVPGVFVALEPLFNHEQGVSFCELEFPIYFNFYVLRRKIRVVCTKATKQRVTAFIREAAFGPEKINLVSEYIGGMSNRAMPDLVKEMAYFRRNPFKGGEPTQLADMVTFSVFDAQGRVELPGAVAIRYEKATRSYRVFDNEVQVAEVPEKLDLPPRSAPRTKAATSKRRRRPFYPPLFGVTIIGSGHGFDPKADTSGFVLWVNHRGIIVDPPVGSTDWLAEREVTRKHVNALILTHCHADHDAGTLQKLFEEQKIPIYTSRTIMDGFVRKAAAITGLTPARVQSLIDYHPITMGPPIRINGAEFRFEYTLHSIPALGFETYFLGKSFVYSGDTLNDPDEIEKLHKMGVMSAGRRDSLLDFPWHHTLIFHEAGVPPLHTPVARLDKLPPAVKRRLFLLHVGRDSVPKDSGLRVAKPGLSKTIRIHVEKNPHSRAIAMLKVLKGVELFRHFPLNRAADFLSIAKEETFKAGDLVLEEGNPGTKFFLIISGKAVVRKGDEVLDEYGPTDYFGETAVVMDIPRTADVFAKTTLHCITIEKADFLYLIRGTDVALKLRRLFINRQLGLGDLLRQTEPFKGLTSTQRTHLESYMDSDFAMDGQRFIKEGDKAERAYLLADGEVNVLHGDKKIVRVDGNTFVADVEALLTSGKYGFSAEAVGNVRLFMISRTALVDFVDLNPGFYFKLTEYERR